MRQRESDTRDEPDDSGQSLDTFSSMVTAEAALLTAVGDYQQKSSLALATVIAAGGDAVIIAQKQEVYRQLKLTYARLRRNQHQAEDQIEVIRRNTARAKWLYQGEHLAAANVSAFWVGYRWLLQQATPEVREILFKTQLADVEREPMNFAAPPHWYSPPVDMGSGGEHVYDSNASAERAREATERMHEQAEAKRRTIDIIGRVPEEYRNVLGLAAWCQENLYMPKIGSPAMRLFSSAVGRLCEAAEKRETQIRAWLKDAEAGVYSVFNPLEIDAIPHNTAALAAGGSKPDGA